ncbi:hypothetical protein D3C87_1885220 [compost metagenome]
MRQFQSGAHLADRQPADEAAADQEPHARHAAADAGDIVVFFRGAVVQGYSLAHGRAYSSSMTPVQ